MGKWLSQKLRGARGFQLFAALAIVALLALLLMRREPGVEQRTDLEARVERILSRIDGVGSVSAMIAQDADGRATGAVIVADSLDSLEALLRLQRAVEALLELEANDIEIIGRKTTFGGKP